jgi:aspartyl-tRNA synthetase
VFKGALESKGSVLGIVVEGGGEKLSRKDLTALEDLAKGFGAKGLAWWKAGADGGAGPLARFAAGERARALMDISGAKEGDILLTAAGKTSQARRVLAELRNHLGRKLGLVKPGWNLLWVTRFPMFEFDEEAGRWFSAHHPFTAPVGDLAAIPADLGELESRAYDLVMNGWELGSGSIRIHRQDVQARVFDLLGIGAEEQRQKFGFLLEALAHGAPPHGGFALGLDRTVALTLGLDSIRDVLAFPKTASASDLLCEAPSPVSPDQLAEVHIAPSGRALAANRARGTEAAAPGS